MCAIKLRGNMERNFPVVLSNRYISKMATLDFHPMRNGSPGTIPEFGFKNLCTAMESYMKINQLNGQGVENSMKNIHNRVTKVMGKEENIVSTSFLNRILQSDSRGNIFNSNHKFRRGEDHMDYIQ